MKEILDAVKQSGRSKRTTFIIVSDHGFRAYKRKIRPMVLLKQNGISVDALNPSNADAWVVPEGGTAGVYVSDPGRKAELIPELRKIFSGGGRRQSLWYRRP